MKTAYFCLFLACLLPIIATSIAKAGDRTYNNRRPRDWLAKQDGYRGRANAAQGNSWEALAIFGVAVLSAMQRGVPQGTVDALAIGFIVARIVYLALYLADLHWQRSLVWFVGLGCSLALFFV
jgi:uncharacterized MAPEG superfamily protein